jgi:hypothetical protein
VRFCETCGAAFQYSRTCPKDGVPVKAGTFDPFIGKVLGDRYKIQDRIGAGSMGQVYRAAHTRIAVTFAIKVVWGDVAYDPATQARFSREAEVASCLQSRWIVRVVDFSSEAGGVPYLVMEFLDGPTLGDVLTRETTLPAERAIKIAQRIALGLAHAHDRGVVHRDLKPDNVVLVKEDEEADVIKLLDFGVAKMHDAQKLTSSGMALGTPLYMSPEAVRGAEVDARSDLYALGVLLVEMLTGKPPFDSPTIEGLLRAHVTERPPSLKAHLDATGAPAELDDVVQRLLAKRPIDRFASARELAHVLQGLGSPAPRASLAPPSSSAASPVPPAVAATLERAILQGAPVYNADDHAGCFAIYRDTATRIVAEHPSPAAVAARLEAGARRAAGRKSATDAAWDLRYAFDDLLMPGPFAPSGSGMLATELAAFASIAGRREAMGQLDILGDYHLAFGRRLADRLREGGDAASAADLDAATARAELSGGGAAAVHAIEGALHGLVSRAATRAGPGPGPVSSALTARSPGPPPSAARPSVPPPSGVTAVSPPPSTPHPPLSRPSLAPVAEETSGSPIALTRLAPNPLRADVRERIMRAIRVGAPAFNEGRHDVCARVYREAALEIVSLTASDVEAAHVEQHLRRALVSAGNQQPTDAAWVLRHAFDAVLSLG